MDEECWLEMDLYWFQGASPEVKAAQLVDRVLPLWQRNPGARRGLSLCVGWLFDTVLGWNGKLQDAIPTCQAPTYEPWTYARFAELITIIKREATRRGVEDLRVALMMIGVASMEIDECEGFSGRTEQVEEKAGYHIASPWFKQHPEVRDDRFDPFYFGATVNVPSDEAICREQKPTFAVYFADKLTSLAENVGLDAIVLRDAIFSPAYVRGNRRARYMDPTARRDWNASIAALLGRIKLNRPQLITIGYNSGISPIEEWRSSGFDLEQLARTGNLDLWITQTWGSAWQDYWPQQSTGFTFQLANVLMNLAMLEPTPCKHLFLIETFDAWEPWDSIHQYPSKVAWEIWAYSHASMLGKSGRISHPRGCYISWMNRREQLLPAKTVEWLTNVMKQSAADLENEPVPLGPCLVYDREAMELSLDHPTDISRGEEIDDWAAMLLKYGVPVLSITRREYVEETSAQAYIIPTVVEASISAWVRERVELGTQFLFIGEAATLPRELRLSLAVEVEREGVRTALPSAGLLREELATRIGTAAVIVNQRRRTLAESPDWDTLISALGGPVFAKHRSLPCWIWETPQWGTLLDLNVTIQTVQSPQTYLAIAESFNKPGWGKASASWKNQDWLKPAAVLQWEDRYGATTVLLGNLETGVTGNSQNCLKGQLAFDSERTSLANRVDALLLPGHADVDGGIAQIKLGPHKVARLGLLSRGAS